MRHLLQVLGLLLCVLASGCMGETSGEHQDAGDCVVDGDCERGTCQFGICATPDPSQLQVHLVIAPPAFRSDLASFHAHDVPVTLGSTLPTYALRAPTPVRGVVLFNATNDGPGTGAEAELRFRSVSDVSGYEFEATTRSAATTGEYEVALPPGLYDVSIQPLRNEVSRTVATGVQVGETADFRPFSLPAPSQYRVVTGVVERDGDGTEPVIGARVYAVSSDGLHESTVDVTDENGTFIVLVPPSDTAFSFQLRPTEDGEDVPTASFDEILIEEDWTGSGLRLALGPYEDRVPVSLRMETTDGEGVTDATVGLRSSIEARDGGPDTPGLLSGRYERRVDSEEIDAYGNVTVLVPPGRTEIYAAGLDESAGLGVPVVVNVRAGQLSVDPVKVTLEQRHVVRGTVAGANGTLIEGARIDAQLRSTGLLPLNRYTVPSSAFGASTETDGAGTFGFQVQPGTWDIDVIPPTGSGHARTRVVLEMERAPIDGFNIELPPSGVVRGVVLDGADEPLAGATVRAFQESTNGLIPVGVAVSDTDGVYRLGLPAVTP